MRQTKIARNILLGIENLLLHKLRSFLTMLGVVFGVGSVVAMLSVGEGASKEALEQIRKLGSNNIIISSMKSAEEEQTSTTHSHMSIYGLTFDDHRRVAESFANIRQTAPAKLMRKESRLRERAMELRVVGATPQWFDLVPRKIVAGRTLLQSDQDKRSPVAVLTEFGARKLLASFTAKADRPGTSRFPTRKSTSTSRSKWPAGTSETSLPSGPRGRRNGRKWNCIRSSFRWTIRKTRRPWQPGSRECWSGSTRKRITR